jgi:hypothetical protein
MTSRPDPTNAERSRRFRQRRKGIEPPAPKLACPACGKIHTGARGLLCCRCWERKTPEGRAWNAERRRAAYQKKRAAAAS